MSKQTIIEYAPGSSPAEEYYHLICEEWSRVNGLSDGFVDVSLTNENETI